LDLEKIKYLLKNEAPYRLRQAEQAIYRDMVNSWQDVTSFPKNLRDMLDCEMPVRFDFNAIKSVDGSTSKALIELYDGLAIETVLLQHRTIKKGDPTSRENKASRNTVCVSSQAGCPMGCVFCRTAKAGYLRNLSSSEILGQVIFFKYFLKDKKSRLTNVVFMGMGEPFLNYENVMDAIRILNDRDRFDIGARKISVSTCGIPDAIGRFAAEGLQVNLAVSLNAPNNNLRDKLMPVNKKYPLDALMPAIREYINKTNRRVMFEYVLIKGLNDSLSAARELASLLKGMLCFVNLIPFNGRGKLKPPDKESVRKFREVLADGGIAATQRYSFGSDISAACGQLVYSDQKYP